MRRIIFYSLAIFFMAACTKDNEQGKFILSFKGVNTTLKSAKSISSVVKIEDFKLSFREIQFKKDDLQKDTSEIHFKGPYDVDLMSESGAIDQTIGSVDIPDGTYKIIRFKLHKSKDRVNTDPLYDRSLFLSGTINGTPFEFWHDASENFDIENSTGIIVNGSTVDLAVVFNIDQFLSSLHNIDLTLAQDEDGNGLIEINPEDDDGNGEIADLIKENIKKAADLVKMN